MKAISQFSSRCVHLSGYLLRLALILPLATSALAATLTGTVTDRTTNKPSAGDDIVLISLSQKMQETSRTTTDTAGHYRIDIPDAGMHLVRVDHQKAAYFAAVAPTATKVDVTVYDVSPKLEKLTIQADMVRAETDAQGLHVIESFFLKNESTPPRTQFSPKSFEIYLPADAKIGASIAMGPGGMPVNSAPVPLGDPGHFTYVFPIRPGETRFQVEYHLPQSDTYNFKTQVSLPTTNYVVVLPQSMTFNALGSMFSPTTGDPNTRNMLAKDISPGKAISFSVSGTGSMPQDSASQGASDGTDTTSDANSAATSPAAADAATDGRPGGGLGAPVGTPDPLSKYKWWIISGIGILLAIAAGIFMQNKPQASLHHVDTNSAKGFTPSAGHSPEAWLAGLKEELFALETERLHGALPDDEYLQQKQALEVMIKRALARKAK